MCTIVGLLEVAFKLCLWEDSRLPSSKLSGEASVATSDRVTNRRAYVVRNENHTHVIHVSSAALMTYQKLGHCDLKWVLIENIYAYIPASLALMLI